MTTDTSSGTSGTHLLILGGTSEARLLAGELAVAYPGWRVTSSLAGRIASPGLPAGEVRVGGFGGAGGLARWLAEHEVTAVIDATHPFARRISRHAAAACAPGSGARPGSTEAVPLLRLERPAWQEQPGDDWHHVPDAAGAAQAAGRLGTRALVTVGRQEAAAFAGAQAWCLVRCIEAPDEPLPPPHELLLDRGPYTEQGERDLIASRGIDVLVTKNSGGAATAPKLTAARQAGIPVVMIDRPPLPPGAEVATSIPEALLWLAAISAAAQVSQGRAAGERAAAGAAAVRGLSLPVSGAAEEVLAALAAGRPVDVDNAAGWPLPDLGPGARAADPQAQARILVTDMAPEVALSFTPELPTLVISPPSLVVGVAASSGVSPASLLTHIRAVLSDNLLAAGSVARLATIDAGSGAPGDGPAPGSGSGGSVPGSPEAVAQAAAWLGVPLTPVPADTLAAQQVPNPSAHTLQVAGVPSIAEAAVLACGATLVVPKAFRSHTGPGGEAAGASAVAVGRLRAPGPDPDPG